MNLIKLIGEALRLPGSLLDRGNMEEIELPPGQRIALHRDFGGDIRPYDRDDGDDGQAVSDDRRRLLARLLTIDMDRKRRLAQYDEMDKSDIASSAVDMYAEDATQPNPDTGETIWVESQSSAIKEAAQEMLENLNIEEEITAIARSIALHGEDFERLIYEPVHGVRSFFWIHPSKMARYEDRYRVLKGYNEEGQKYDAQPYTSNAGVRAPRSVSGMTSTKKLSAPWDYLHFRNRGRFRHHPYGTSILHNAIRPWRMIILSEDQALMYRLYRAPDRFAFFIDTGNASEPEQWNIVNRFRRKYKKNEFVDPISGRYDHRFNPITPLEDVFLGIGRDSKTKIERLFGSANVNDVTDLIYYIRKFCAAVRVPPEALGLNFGSTGKSEDGLTMYSPRSGLASQSHRYARSVARLQRAVREGIRHALQIHLRLKSLDPEDMTYDWQQSGNEFTVKMSPPSNLDEQDRIDAENVRVALAKAMQDLGMENAHIDLYNWTTYVMRRVFHLSNDELRKLVRNQPQDRDGQLPPEEREAADAIIAHAGNAIRRAAARTSPLNDGDDLALPRVINTRVDPDKILSDSYNRFESVVP